MNRRERNLALAVAVLLVVIGLYFAVTRITTAFAARRTDIAKLQHDIDDRERNLKRAARDEKRLRVYRQMSLPSDTELAASAYREWLNQNVNEIGASKVSITSSQIKAAGKGFVQHKFTVKCHANLSQITRFLFQFYSTDQLHRVQQLSLRPVPESKDLDVTLRIEALSLNKSDNERKLNDAPAYRLQNGDLAKYTDKILGRNLFAPANNAPKIALPGRQTVAPNRTLSVAIKATDPDKLDQIKYSLADDKSLPGAKIDSKSGQFSWTPKEKGDFEVTILATDDGFPARSDKQTIKIAVADPPPPPPPPKKKLDFDNAKHTVLTGITKDNQGKVQAWLLIKPTGETLFLNEGDKIDVGSVQGTVTRIGERGAEIETEEQRMLISIGQNLLEGTKLPDAEL